MKLIKFILIVTFSSFLLIPAIAVANSDIGTPPHSTSDLKERDDFQVDTGTISETAARNIKYVQQNYEKLAILYPTGAPQDYSIYFVGEDKKIFRTKQDGWEAEPADDPFRNTIQGNEKFRNFIEKEAQKIITAQKKKKKQDKVDHYIVRDEQTMPEVAATLLKQKGYTNNKSNRKEVVEKIENFNPALLPNDIQKGVNIALPHDLFKTFKTKSDMSDNEGSKDTVKADTKKQKKETYTIKPSDTMSEIAEKILQKRQDGEVKRKAIYHYVDKLIKNNPDLNPNNLTAGQRIILP